MRISSIFVAHFLGIEQADIRLRAPTALFCGANGAGKSSLRDGIALALTADLGRVGLKKEAPALIRAGADLATCQITDADGDTYSVSINRSGKITDSLAGKDHDPALPYVLDAQRVARMTPAERREFLFGLMGVSTTGPAIAAALRERGLDEAKVTRIEPLLRAGFDAGHKEAKAKATEAKGAWRAVSGETYGSEKAKGWKASVPHFDAAALSQARTAVQHADIAIGQWQQKVGGLEAEERRRTAMRGKVPALQDHAGRIARLEAKLQADTDMLAEVAQQLQAAQAAAGGAPRVGLVHELARALRSVCILIDEAGATALLRGAARQAADHSLSAYESQFGEVDANPSGDAAAAARLPELTAAHRGATSAKANTVRDLDAARAAKAELDAINAELAETFDAAGLSEARERIGTLQAQRAAAQKRCDDLATVKAAVDAADRKTTEAAKHAADVAAWDAIAEALGPDPAGLPAQMLAKALQPLNDRLAQSSADAEWPLVRIADDMAISADGREYRLLSESEKWRVDAMLAEAVAHLSGTRLLVLDRGDVLDLKGRGDLLAWLDVLAENGEIDTALVFMTLKGLPTGLPGSVEAHWIDGGVIGQRLKEAA